MKRIYWMPFIWRIGLVDKISLKERITMKKDDNSKMMNGNVRSKKNYSTPVLKKFGEVKKLTAGGSSGQTERQSWQTRKQRS